MTDREKIVWSLERCASSVPDACRDCKYDNFPPRICVAHLTKDALALLKAQEPRVLTVEEVRNNCPDYVYIETKTGWLECTIQDCGESDKYDGYFVYGRDEYFMESWDIYGTWWRCWSAKPSDAERKAVAWND